MRANTEPRLAIVGIGQELRGDDSAWLEVVRCLGACGIAQVMVVNDRVHPQLTPEAAVAIVDALVRREVAVGGNGTAARREEDGR